MAYSPSFNGIATKVVLISYWLPIGWGFYILKWKPLLVLAGQVTLTCLVKF